jgi:hypothetical protein
VESILPKDNREVAFVPVVMGNTRLERVFPNRYNRVRS